MTKRRFAAVLTGLILLVRAGAACSGGEGAPPEPAALEAPAAGDACCDGETFRGGVLGLPDPLGERGLTLALTATSLYQANVRGGLSTHRREGRWAGSWDLELEFDLERLAGLPGATVYALTEGSWRDGIDGVAVGSLFGVNDDAGGNRAADVTELWLQQEWADGRLRLRAGKLDLTGGFECRGCPVGFDGNRFANDETAQFLNGALVNNPSIPFPDNGLGLIVYGELAPWWYVVVGGADAAADARETGFNTALHDEDYFLVLVETGVVLEIPSPGGPLTGVCRVGAWYDPQPKERFDGRGAERDDRGFYASVDQTLWREPGDAGNGREVGFFGRFGAADGDANEVELFWSGGLECRGPIPGRADDILGIGFARARLSGDAGFRDRSESVVEAYYRIALAPWLSVTPSVQHVLDPGGGAAADATVAGVRVQVAF